MPYTYSKLKRRIKQLEEIFLAKTNNINSKNQDLIKSFILLSHAEFESYIEQIALDKINKLENDWRTSRKANYNSGAIFLYYEIKNKKDILSAGCEALSMHKKTITINNGIKEENLIRIFKPLGFNVNNFENSIVTSLNTLGSIRGKFAHNSKFKITDEYDLNTERRRVNDIATNLNGFREKILNNYKDYIIF